MTYQMYFADIKIGDILEEDRDFPNLWGRISYEKRRTAPTSEMAVRLARFIELNQESIRFADLENDPTSSEKLEVNAELEAYLDFVESNDWHLIDQNGEQYPILCPILRHDGHIVWRWNPR